ncbi:hypothetical protein KSS87_001858 [Heliosperma pusillum]|nr:hypothetical protein KSS87_001858 [Heliosperma pusillum]
MSFQDLEAGGRKPLATRNNLINAKQEPTQAVASGIFQINTAVSTFQRLVNTLGTPKDTPQLREKLFWENFGGIFTFMRLWLNWLIVGQLMFSRIRFNPAVIMIMTR